MRLKRGVRVLDRGDGSIQVGVHPAVVIYPANPSHRAWLESLEARGTIPPGATGWRGDSIAALREAGLLTQAELPAATATVHDGGAIGLGIGRCLATAGWTVRFCDEAPAASVPRGIYHTGMNGGSRQQAAANAVRASGARASLGEGRADVEVIVSSGAQGIEKALPLMAADVPHLFVTAHDGGVLLGPFVMPGRGACGLCHGLALAAHDAAWPLLAVQLGAPGGTPPHAEPAHVAITAGLAAAALDAWRRDVAGACDATDEWLNAVWWVDDHGVTKRALAANASCGCGATGSVGDELAARRAAMRPGS